MASGTAVVTGGNSGLGLETVRAMAARGAVSDLVVACRDVSRGQAAVDSVATGATRLHVAELDLASLDSVRAFPAVIDALGVPPIVAVVCNAGVQVIGGTRLSQDGIEETFAVNVLGHFALVKLLLHHLAAQARVIFISSGTHDPALKTGMPNPRYAGAADLAKGLGPDDLDGGALGRFRYTTSKLCDVYLAYEFAKRYPMSGESGPTLVVSAMDPGLMAGSGLARDYGVLSRFVWRRVLPRLSRFIKGASTTEASGADVARLATDPAFAEESGLYYIGTTPSPSSVLSYDQFNAVDLWNTCATLAGIDP
jgi:NAD(P)-dependent dehydrogenase (short-subunit alcohol dehydrogenase family)